MTQQDIFNHRRTRADQLREKFAEFHRANPNVYQRLCYHADSLIRRGAKKYSVYTLLYVIRWERDMHSIDEETGFSINDHTAPYYARMWEIDHPEPAEFFTKRKLVSEERPPRRGGEATIHDVRPDVPSADLDDFLRLLLRETRE